MDKYKTAVLWTGLMMLFLGAVYLTERSGRMTGKYVYSKEAFGNPLMGFAPEARNRKVSGDVSLVYIDVTWRELEPSEGDYDWESIEAENNFLQWKKEGKHGILRFLCDLPGEVKHLDIPDWLYEKTGGAGDWYDMEYGKGFSPDYGNQELIWLHERAAGAMGKRWGKDGFIRYIELGSLGHWGEWHVNTAAGIRSLPPEALRDKYVSPWVRAFPGSSILMRRPFTQAGKYGLGVYNDMTGEPEATEEWLEWLERGGIYDQTGEDSGLVSMKEFWRKAPAGGEFTSSVSMEELLETELPRTLKLLEKSHITFLGPKTADSEYREGYEQVLKGLGYRLWISESTLRKRSGGAALTLIWENSGAAPFYENWEAYVYLEDSRGKTLEKKKLSVDYERLQPGQRMTDSVFLKKAELRLIRKGRQRITVGIVNPETGKDSVRLAMETPWKKGRNRLF